MDLIRFKKLHDKRQLPPTQLWVIATDSFDSESYVRAILPPVSYVDKDLALHPNYFLLSPLVDKKDITVETLSPLFSFLKNTPALLGARVVLINHAERLNIHSTNALLKSLEDVPPCTYFILTTATPKKILATLRSRCTVFVDPTPSTPYFISAPTNQQLGKLLLTLLVKGIPSFNTLLDALSDEDVVHLRENFLFFVKTIIDYGHNKDLPPSPGIEKLYTLHPRAHWVSGYLAIEDYMYLGVNGHLPPRELLRGCFFLMQNPRFFTFPL